MPETAQELYCSESCRAAPMVRSYGICPECGNEWDGTGASDNSHYRNNAWQLCVMCSRNQCRCVVCGAGVTAQS